MQDDRPNGLNWQNDSIDRLITEGFDRLERRLALLAGVIISAWIITILTILFHR
jgi:hypothetical protein